MCGRHAVHVVNLARRGRLTMVTPTVPRGETLRLIGSETGHGSIVLPHCYVSPPRGAMQRFDSGGGLRNAFQVGRRIVAGTVVEVIPAGTRARAGWWRLRDLRR